MASKILATAILLAASSVSAVNVPRDGAKFTLVAHTTTPTASGPNVDGFEVGFTRPQTDTGIVTLTAPGDGHVLTGQAGNIISVADFGCSSGGAGEWVVNPGGTATVPNENMVVVGCVGGSPDFTIEVDESRNGGEQTLTFAGGKWAACKGSAVGLDDSYNVLNFMKDGQRPLEGCQEIVLVPTFV